MDISWAYALPLWVTGTVILIILLLAVEAGRLAGLRVHRRRDEIVRTLSGDVTLTALLALLGLILAFTYSFSLGRYEQRKDAMVAEVNALSTAFQRAELLPPPGADTLRRKLLDYARTRQVTAEMFKTPEKTAQTMERTLQEQAALWPVTRAALTGDVPAPVAVSVAAAINTVLDVHTERVTAGFDHIPAPVLFVLVLVSALSLGMAAYSAAVQGYLPRARFVTFAVVLVALILIIMDFDTPMSGLIQLQREELKTLVRNMEAELAS